MLRMVLLSFLYRSPQNYKKGLSHSVSSSHNVVAHLDAFQLAVTVLTIVVCHCRRCCLLCKQLQKVDESKKCSEAWELVVTPHLCGSLWQLDASLSACGGGYILIYMWSLLFTLYFVD